MKRIFFYIFSAAILLGGMLYSCGGGGSSNTLPATGTVGLYITDDMSLMSQVTATVNKVQLVNTGMGTSCDMLAAPVTLNIANLANVMQLVDVTQCPAGPYNRFRIEFEKGVQLLSGTTGTVSSCSFTSYMANGMGMAMQPNNLSCDPDTNICTLDVNGAVNVLGMQDNKLALDFDLKNFSVMNMGLQDCSVTMKVSPMGPGQMRQHGSEAITGIISNLNTRAMAFDLTRGNRTYSVLYSGITNSNQPDLNTLLQRAQGDRLRTVVTASTIDLGNNSIRAAAIAVKVEGTVSNLSNAIFTVNYGTGGTKTISIDSTNAAVSGSLGNGLWVDVKLTGYDPLNSNFVAGKVEVETMGMITED